MDPRFVVDLASALGETALRRARGRRVPRDWSVGYESLVRALQRTRARIDRLSVPGQRAVWDGLAAPSPALARVRVEATEIAGVPCRVVEPRAASPDAPTALYFHGGAYVFGSFATHGALVARLATSGGLRVVFPEYRLAPEHPYPAAIDDARAVYAALSAGGAPIALAGDSAGGGISAALGVRARDEGLPRPAGLALLSPFVDHDAWDEVHPERAALDWLTVPWGKGYSAHYVPAGQDPAHPWISPARADLSGLPPTLLQIGDAELLYEQSMRFAERARAAGVELELDVEPGMTHSYQMFADLMPTCGASIDRAARFLRAAVARASMARG